MRVRDWGRADYLSTWQAMREFTAARNERTPDELWVVEHAPVYTLGQAGRREHLRDTGGIPVLATDRGGQVTYHGPGQAIVYTLVDLRRAGYFVRELVYRLEEAALQVLDGYGVSGERIRSAPGVYVAAPPLAHAPDERFSSAAKIAALGIKVHRGCAYHGLAFNVAMDLSPFARIDPCGYAGLRTVDLATLGVRATMAQVAARLVERLQAHLGARRPQPEVTAS